MNNKKQSNKETGKRPIYSLSGYASVHFKDGEKKGFTIQGWRKDEDGGKEYCTIWVPAEKVSAKKTHDGQYLLSFKFVEVEVRQKSTQEEKEAKKQSADARKKQGSGKKFEGSDDIYDEVEYMGTEGNPF